MKIEEILKRIHVANVCGLSYVGLDEDGEPEFLGRREQFEQFDILINE